MLPDVWVRGPAPVTALERARAAWCWSGGRGVLAGWSAAAVLGARWLPDDAPAEIVLRTTPSMVIGLRPWRWTLDPAEVETVDGIRVTTPTRTAFDLGRRLPLLDAVPAVDDLCWVGVAEPGHVLRHSVLHPGTRGVVDLRAAVALADPDAGSPQESRTRVAVLQAGLPRPRSQLEVFTAAGRFVAQLDMGWNRWRVGVEYDGAHHRDGAQQSRDTIRAARLIGAGWTVAVVTADDLRCGAPEGIAATTAALRRAGADV